MSIADEVKRLKEAKIKIKLSIEGKGVIVPSEATFTVYPEYIEDIETQGKYQDKGAIPSTEQQVIEPDEGYDALRRVLVEAAPLEEKTVIPSTSGSEVLPTGDNIGLSKVTVTGDANLVGSNIKKDTTIFGVTGTFEGGEGDDDYTKLGETVTVQAKNSFKKGDIFIGEKNPNATGGIQSETLIENGSPRPAGASEDLSVIVPWQTISTNGLKLYIANSEGGYTNITVPVDENAVNGQLNGQNGVEYTMNISADGTYIIVAPQYSKQSGILLVKINKNNVSATSNFITGDALGKNIVIETGGEPYTDGYVASVNYSSGLLVGDKFLVFATVKYNGGSSSMDKIVAYDYSYSTNTLRFNCITNLPGNYSINKKLATVIDDNTAIWVYKPGLNYNRFYKISCRSSVTGELLFEANGMAITNISKNGKYLAANNGSIYKLDIDNKTVTQIGQIPGISGTNVMVDSTGNYALMNKTANYDVYEVSTGNLIYNSTNATGELHPCGCDYFELINGYYLCTKSFQYGTHKAYYGYSDVQYYIRNTQAYIETADRIYGIVPRDMEMEEKGTAQNLFNTFGLETEETETVE